MLLMNSKPLNRILTPEERARLIAGLEKAAKDPRLSPEARALSAKRAAQMRKIQARRVN